jgi:hypothetical protein
MSARPERQILAARARGAARKVKHVYTPRSAVVQSPGRRSTFMKWICAFLLAALVAATPLSAAAQDRDGRDRDRSDQARQEPRRISVSEAQAIAESRARGAAFVGYVGVRGGQYVFRFDRGGQIFDVAVPMTGR